MYVYMHMYIYVLLYCIAVQLYILMAWMISLNFYHIPNQVGLAIYTTWQVDGATPMQLVYHWPLLSHLLGVAPPTFTTAYIIFLEITDKTTRCSQGLPIGVFTTKRKRYTSSQELTDGTCITFYTGF